jgi:asparagine synthase (glutamine-hydrolysing)
MPRTLAEINRNLAHRGPDGSGTWVDEAGRVALCHTRLAVIDLETGTQPIANEDGSLRVVVNGEFYDYVRIRRELESRGHRFQTGSASEILLHLYEEEGVGALRHLRGEFAFVLWDGRRERLFVARDRFGIKPLFYAETNGLLHVASEGKALFASGVPAAWDFEAVHRTLFFALDQSASLFRGIRQLPAGHFLLADASGLGLHRYWEVDYPRRRATPPRDAASWADIARTKLEEAVRLRLQADVPVGCLLSGGLDSAATLGIATALSSRPVAAFTVAFDDPDFDESARARATAAMLGADFHRVPVSVRDVADHFADTVWSGEMVQYNAHGVGRYLLSREVRRAGYKAVLAGEGGDELFAGYHFCAAAISPNGNPARTPSWIRLLVPRLGRATQVQREIAATSPWLARGLGVLKLPDGLISGLADKLSVLQALIAPEVRRAVAPDPYGQLFRSLRPLGQLRGREPVKQILYLWMKTVFANYVLAGERLDMAHSVEVRLPLLDHELFHSVKGIPAAILAKDGEQKWVLREAARSVISDEVRGGVKRGFLAPAWTRMPGTPLRDLVEDTLRGPSLAALPFFERSAVVRLLDELPAASEARRASLDPLILMILSLCVLQERFRL